MLVVADVVVGDIVAAAAAARSRPSVACISGGRLKNSFIAAISSSKRTCPSQPASQPANTLAR